MGGHEHMKMMYLLFNELKDWSRSHNDLKVINAFHMYFTVRLSPRTLLLELK